MYGIITQQGNYQANPNLGDSARFCQEYCYQVRRRPFFVSKLILLFFVTQDFLTCSHNTFLCMVPCFQRFFYAWSTFFFYLVNPLKISHKISHNSVAFFKIQRCVDRLRPLHFLSISVFVLESQACSFQQYYSMQRKYCVIACASVRDICLCSS